MKRLRPPVRRPKFLPDELVPSVMSQAGDDEDLLATAFYTGLRKGELCGLRVEDVDFPMQAITVRRSYDKATTKGRRERVAYIHRELVPYLLRAVERAKENDWVWLFPNAEGVMRTKHWDAADAFRQCLKRAKLITGYRHMCRRKGCGFREERKDDAVSRCPDCDFLLWVDAIPQDFTFKHTRSTWGTHAYRATGDIRMVQEGLGHTDVSVTEAHYSHALAEHQIEQLNKLHFGRALPHGDGKAELAEVKRSNVGTDEDKEMQ